MDANKADSLPSLDVGRIAGIKWSEDSSLATQQHGGSHSRSLASISGSISPNLIAMVPQPLSRTLTGKR